jgi:TPR repeat protein
VTQPTRLEALREGCWHLIATAKNGHPHAQNLVGYYYNLGLGPRRNRTTAVRWYKKAAKNGYSEATYNLALSYAHGRGILNENSLDRPGALWSNVESRWQNSFVTA